MKPFIFDISGRALKKKVQGLLLSPDWLSAKKALESLPARKAVNPLTGFLCSSDENVRWRAVEALGIVVSHLAKKEPESARVVLRRLLWMLNDESGGIGWGAPEAIGEILARDGGRLAEEFGRLLVSYVNPSANFLEHPALRRGALWGIGRLAQVRPDITLAATDDLYSLLSDPDPANRGLAARALGLMAAPGVSDGLCRLLCEPFPVNVWEDGQIRHVTVAGLARKALASARPLGYTGESRPPGSDKP
ncbi:MAG: HEAT repeat domain-containing protein [Deltaproteobacteria bacterium]|nr:HEAT repeat domain-containing protein [Deltaproteobacteria bacterium]